MQDAEQPAPFSLLRAVATLARGGTLDAKLAALSSEVTALTGADAVAVLLADGDGTILDARDARPVPVTGPDGDAIRQALEERRSVEVGHVSGTLAEALGGSASGLLVPLVVSDDLGEEIQGLLALGWAGSATATEMDEELGALADLVAVAIRQARLHNTLWEQADYTDRLAHTDRLTGLANQVTFERMLELEIARATRQGSPMAVALFTVDGLREMRGTSRARADGLLRLVASTFADRVRLLDTVARISDDQFAVIAPGDASGTVATRLRDAASSLPVVDGIGVSVSGAVVHHPDDGATGIELLTAARASLERARAVGPGAVVGTRSAPS
jgi:diguanylate cyclase (GGDEF)-like protein